MHLQFHCFLRCQGLHRLYSCRSIPSLSDWFMHSRRPMRCLLTIPWRFETDRKEGKPTESEVLFFSFWTNSKTTFGTVERCWKKVVECFYMFLLSLKSRGLFFEVHAICIRDFTPGAWPNFSNVPPIASQSASGPWSWSIVPVATSNKSFCRDTQWSVTIHSNPIWFSGKWRNKNIFINNFFKTVGHIFHDFSTEPRLRGKWCSIT